MRQNRQRSECHRPGFYKTVSLCLVLSSGISSCVSTTTSKVISLDLRTALMDGEGVFAQEGFKGEGQQGKEEEIDYCTVLNRSD